MSTGFAESDVAQLTLFEGREVVANTLAIGGTIKDPALQPLTELPLGGRVVLLVVGSVVGVGFTDGDLGRIRHQKVAVMEAHDLEGHVSVQPLLDMLRAHQEVALDHRMSLIPSPDALVP